MAWMIPCTNLFSRATVSNFSRHLRQRSHCAATGKTVNLLWCWGPLEQTPPGPLSNAGSLHFTQRAPLCHSSKSQLNFHRLIVPIQGESLLLKGISRTFYTGPVCLSRLGPQKSSQGGRHINGVIYIIAVFVFMVGASYAAVPLYKIFCQATGLGGQPTQGHDISKIDTMVKVDRKIKVKFSADVNSSMQWNFKPQQTEVNVLLGETALAFYTAKNPTKVPIIGISTYNVVPFEAALYFNKIQCFCFEEQRLNPGEQVDMPVFFYIDPEFALDPKLEDTETITLSYTFFEAKDGLQLPLPGYAQPHNRNPIPM